MHKKTFELANPRMKVTLEADDLQVFEHCQRNWEGLARTLTGHFAGPSMKEVFQKEHDQREEAMGGLKTLAPEGSPPEPVQIDLEDAIHEAAAVSPEVFEKALSAAEEADALPDPIFKEATPEDIAEALGVSEEDAPPWEDKVQPFSEGMPSVKKKAGRPKGSKNK